MGESFYREKSILPQDLDSLAKCIRQNFGQSSYNSKLTHGVPEAQSIAFLLNSWLKSKTLLTPEEEWKYLV